MFKLAISPSFLAPVSASIAADKGKFEKIRFHVRFKRLSLEEYQDLNKRLLEARLAAEVKERETGVPTKPTFGDKDLLDEVLVGFGDDVGDAEGKPLEYTPENVERLMSVFPIQARTVASFFEWFGKAAEKN